MFEYIWYLIKNKYIDEIYSFLTYCQNSFENKKPKYKYLKALLQKIKYNHSLSDNLEWYEAFKDEDRNRLL